MKRVRLWLGILSLMLAAAFGMGGTAHSHANGEASCTVCVNASVTRRSQDEQAPIKRHFGSGRPPLPEVQLAALATVSCELAIRIAPGVPPQVERIAVKIPGPVGEDPVQRALRSRPSRAPPASN